MIGVRRSEVSGVALGTGCYPRFPHAVSLSLVQCYCARTLGKGIRHVSADRLASPRLRLVESLAAGTSRVRVAHVAPSETDDITSG